MLAWSRNRPYFPVSRPCPAASTRDLAGASLAEAGSQHDSTTQVMLQITVAVPVAPTARASEPESAPVATVTGTDQEPEAAGCSATSTAP